VLGSVLGGYWLDEGLLIAPAQGDVQMSVVAGGRVVASTRPVEGPEFLEVDFGETFEADINGGALARAGRLNERTSVVAWTPQNPLSDRATLVRTAMLGLLFLALAATAVLAYKLARLVTQDLEELTEGARAMTEGRFEHRVPVRSKDEVGMLAQVFNEMAERLSETITQLSSSRDQLQRTIRRVGETLRSTHDMSQILDAVLHTGIDAVHADAATFWTFTPTREEVYPAIGVGAEVNELQRLEVGEGIIGLVAERGIATSVPVPGGPRPARGEPAFPNVLALPIYNADRIYGVVAFYRRAGKRPFSEKDVETVEFLTEQGAVALENVTLHEEANRLSLTDGLTGVYNRRYLQMQFRQVLATAVRFDRPFSVLMLDLDDFKNVNDSFGHQRGDAILIEFAQRVNRNLREVDTFSRYGGEEFVALLSETDVYGAVTTAEKILDSVRSEPFGGSGETPIELTVSIGVASYPDHGDSYKGLVESADRGLYRAKREGKDRVAVAEEGPTPGLTVAK
jgi:diguanylate cyclase (GGDEF)-like protein